MYIICKFYKSPCVYNILFEMAISYMAIFTDKIQTY